MTGISWAAVFTFALIVVSLCLAIVAAVAENLDYLEYAVVVALCAIAFALLSLRDR